MTIAEFLESLKPKDRTAQGVAKIRHLEQMLSNRLYDDPYAQEMYPGSTLSAWIGRDTLLNIYRWFQPGMFEIITLRTKWIDEAILASPFDQLLILGAGYDTRGYRLDLSDGFVTLEVDQPDVQNRKLKNIRRIAQTDEKVASRMEKSTTGPTVEYVSIDFNTDCVRAKTILEPTSLDGSKPTIVTLEGVTQYIPDTSTATTLKQVHGLFPEESLLLISYVPDALYDYTNKSPQQVKQLNTLLELVKWSNEPWITSWSPESFASFLKDCGYAVVSDVSVEELNDQYLVPLDRGLQEDEKLELERYVVAKIVK